MRMRERKELGNDTTMPPELGNDGGLDVRNLLEDEVEETGLSLLEGIRKGNDNEHDTGNPNEGLACLTAQCDGMSIASKEVADSTCEPSSIATPRSPSPGSFPIMSLCETPIAIADDPACAHQGSTPIMESTPIAKTMESTPIAKKVAVATPLSAAKPRQVEKESDQAPKKAKVG